MSDDELQRLCVSTVEAMRGHAEQFVTPIIRETSPGHAQAHGTGNYLRIHGAPYLLTNEHVIRQAEGQPLFHQPTPPEDYLRLEHHVDLAEWPIDAALMRIGSEWDGSGKTALDASRLDDRYAPLPGELLFFAGYPGTIALRGVLPAEYHIRHTWFETIESRGIPFLGQQVEGDRVVDEYNESFHVLMHYPERAFRQVAGPEEPSPNLKGVSGSLLWDTKVLRCKNEGREWTPDVACVCGLVRADNYAAEVIIATKIEHVRSVLLNWVRRERAFLHWRDRGNPLWEQEVDWAWAEETYHSLS